MSIYAGLQLVGQLGSGSIPSDLPPPEPCDDAGLCWTFGSLVSLSLTPVADGQCHFVKWTSQFDSLSVISLLVSNNRLPTTVVGQSDDARRRNPDDREGPLAYSLVVW